LFCCFAGYCERIFGELVSMMEHDLDYSMETFYELCESPFSKAISEEILGEQRDEEKRNTYDVG